MAVDTIGVHESVAGVFPPDRLVDELSGTAPQIEVVTGTRGLEQVDLLVTLEYEPEFTAVDWIHSIQAGVDRFPFSVLADEGVVLTNSTGIHGDFVGETVVGYLLAFARGLHEAARNQTERRWERPPWDELFTIADETLCIVGLGTLGRGVAEKASGMALHVTGVKQRPEATPHVGRVFPAEELHDAISDARFVVLALPLNEETEGLLGADELAVMRNDAYLVNVSRGPIVDLQALLDAIRTESIAGAALDVFETEPLPTDSPIWDVDDVIVSPHIAGVSSEYYRRVADLVKRNLQHLESGAELVNQVV